MRDCSSLSRIWNVVKWNVIEDNGTLTVSRLNEPHSKQGGFTRARHFSSTAEEFERYETFVIRKYHVRRHDIYPLIEDEWTRVRSRERERLETEAGRINRFRYGRVEIGACGDTGETCRG